jgi:hypothetical protein
MRWQRLRPLAVALAASAVAACTPGATEHPATPSAATSTAATGVASPTPAPSTTPIAEPTTTNTLPPPPNPTKPAPRSAGPLNASSLPVPAGWRRVVRSGGEEEGYQGNGTWVHGRDPRYAAQDVITVGCAPVTRDDYIDPVAALEGTYESRRRQPGVGLVMQFKKPTEASHFFRLLVDQVSACTDAAGQVRTAIVRSSTGLVDRRTYPDSTWTEIGRQVGSRVTLIILADPGHRISVAAAERILAQIG